MVSFLWRWVVRLAVAVLLVVATIVVVRAVDAWRQEPLALWHTVVPEELDAAALDHADLAAYLAAEDAAFATVQSEVTAALPPRDRVRFDRYWAESSVYPPNLARDYNRTLVLAPEGPVRGAVVLLHGLTDSPYSLRHIAERYRDHGYVAIAIRLPGHGTVPGGLTEVEWEDWLAATRLAMREARRRAGPSAPVDIVGYSNGGALALAYALDAIDDPALVKPRRVVLFSPMIGVTEFARFAGLAGLPAVLPAFVNAAWLNVVPEFNPFKYNSFPVNAARQSYLLTQALQARIEARARDGSLNRLAPVLTFQSVLDHTVLTSAVIALHDRLGGDASELVLFDVNHASAFDELMRPRAVGALERLLPPPPRRFRATVVTNRGPDVPEVEARTTAAGAVEAEVRPLGLVYPGQVYSLSHIATPFPLDDGLYGLVPDPAEDFGISLGNVAARGEFGALLTGVDITVRMSSNPFFPFVLDRIDAGFAGAGP